MLTAEQEREHFWLHTTPGKGFVVARTPVGGYVYTRTLDDMHAHRWAAQQARKGRVTLFLWTVAEVNAHHAAIAAKRAA